MGLVDRLPGCQRHYGLRRLSAHVEIGFGWLWPTKRVMYSVIVAGAIAISVTNCAPRNAMAGQVVIHVAAIVDQLEGDADSIPTPLTVGDNIVGRYSFDASEFDANHTAALGSPRLFLGDLDLQSSNSAGLVLNEGLVVPPINPPSDTLLIQCSSPTNVFPRCNTNRFPENENRIWDPTLTLFANSGSLQTLADVRSLSSLSSISATGTLRIEISELDPNEASLEHVLTIQATITEFVAVPEPAALVLGILAASIAVAGLRTRIQRGGTTGK